jgi:hypothetical protein
LFKDTAKIVGISLAIFGVLAVLGIAVWGFKVATSDIKGSGDATRQINSADNRIGSQEHFHTLMADILKSDRALDIAAADKAAHPGDDFYATNYSGMVKHCIDVVEQYNADAQKVSKSKWLDPNLPQIINPNDPTTDCKESNA